MMLVIQGRTQDRADGAKAPPPSRNPLKKIIYSFKFGAFYVSQFVHPVADYVPRFNWLIDITISPIAVVDKFFLHNKRLVL